MTPAQQLAYLSGASAGAGSGDGGSPEPRRSIRDVKLAMRAKGLI